MSAEIECRIINEKMIAPGAVNKDGKRFKKFSRPEMALVAKIIGIDQSGEKWKGIFPESNS